MKHGRAGDMPAGLRSVHGRRVQAVRDGEVHQAVPGGMELDLVDPVAVAVVRAQDGGFSFAWRPSSIAVAAGELAHALDRGRGPAAALALERLDQRAVLLERRCTAPAAGPG